MGDIFKPDMPDPVAPPAPKAAIEEATFKTAVKRNGKKALGTKQLQVPTNNKSISNVLGI